MFWITTIIFILSLNEACESKSQLRVLDGRDAKEGEFPYVVSLLFYQNDTSKAKEAKPKRFCTGSLISQDWVLTAGHCGNAIPLELFYIWHAAFTTTPLGSKFIKKVRKVFLHPALVLSLTAEIVKNDISLLLVDQLATNTFGRLLAIDHLTMIGLPVMYVGSGTTNKPGDDQLRPLQVGEAGIVPCSELFSDAMKYYVVCITAKCHNRLGMPSGGDSGGPLLYDGRIIGVCSAFVIDDMTAEATYSAVSPHIDWIHNVMQQKYDQITPSVPVIN